MADWSSEVLVCCGVENHLDSSKMLIEERYRVLLLCLVYRVGNICGYTQPSTVLVHGVPDLTMLLMVDTEAPLFCVR